MSANSGQPRARLLMFEFLCLSCSPAPPLQRVRPQQILLSTAPPRLPSHPPPPPRRCPNLSPPLAKIFHRPQSRPRPPPPRRPRLLPAPSPQGQRVRSLGRPSRPRPPAARRPVRRAANDRRLRLQLQCKEGTAVTICPLRCCVQVHSCIISEA